MGAYSPPQAAATVFTAATQICGPVWIPGASYYVVRVDGTFTGSIQLRRQLGGDRPTGISGTSNLLSMVAQTDVNRFNGAGAWHLLYAATLSSGTVAADIRFDCGGSMVYQAPNLATATLGQLNDVCGPIMVKGGGSFTAQLVGSFGMTVVVERSFDGGSTWSIMDSNLSTSEDYTVGATCLVRLRVSAYTSGTPTAQLAVGQDA